MFAASVFRVPLFGILRRVAPVLAMLAVLGMVASPAPIVAQSSDNLRYAAIVVDAASGEVLFARYADSRRYPASITKVMTLYLAFEALAEGRARLSDELVISPRAASQPPSKLGLAAGQTISLDDAMRATAVRSANDMAVAIAEHISGSEARFAALMTLKAEQLGMTQTRYVNSNGLPDSRQLTSARDLAILSRAVMRDFPQYYHYFGQHDWAYNGRGYRNTNGLLSAGAGFDGIKTGFTNASGYNLAASQVRDGRRLITIVLGGRSSATRNTHVADLMNVGFEVERLRGQGQSIQVAQAFFEQRGFGVGPEAAQGAVAYAALNSTPETGVGSSEVAYMAGPPPAAPPTQVTPAPSAQRPPPVVRAEARAPETLTASLNGGERAAPARAPARTAPAPAAAPRGAWSVQVGAFRDETVARNWLAEVNRRFRSQFGDAERSVQTAAGWYRSRFTGLSREAAEAACSALTERRVTCMVIRPN